MLKANTKLGSIPVQVEADTIKDLIMGLTFFTEAPCECGHCGGPNLSPQGRVVEDNSYFEIKCKDCGFRLPLGQHKKGDTLFVNNSKGWQEPFRGKQDNE
jgi:DNA-directed RNA polymerase subunit RPC12/RpoP